MEKFPITNEGLSKMKEELDDLRLVHRPKIIAEIASARELGDLSENAEYHAAREQQSFIEGRVIELEDKIARAEVIDLSKISGNKVKFGAKVRLIDNATNEESFFQIVGEYEADVASNKLSISSPTARALIGKEVGDVVEVQIPKGLKSYEILSVVYEN